MAKKWIVRVMGDVGEPELGRRKRRLHHRHRGRLQGADPMTIDWCEEHAILNDAYINMAAELDSARRERDEAMAARNSARDERNEAVANLARYKAYAFGNGLLKLCGVDDLPFLVRCAMGQAVRQIFAEWQAAGSPQDVPTLKALFPGER